MQTLAMLYHYILMCISSEKLSQEALQNYTSTSLKYKRWFKPLDVSSSSENPTTSCYDSVQETTREECVLGKLVEVPLNDFWPFNVEVIKKNQMLAILSATDEMVENENRALKQMVGIPSLLYCSMQNN